MGRTEVGGHLWGAGSVLPCVGLETEGGPSGSLGLFLKQDVIMQLGQPGAHCEDLAGFKCMAVHLPLSPERGDEKHVQPSRPFPGGF